jgi:dTDP-glucose 4,6-dehydratase
MPSTRVLLTGIAGFIGSHFLEHLLTNTDWQIVGVASWQHKGTPERVGEILAGHLDWAKRVDVITHDLSQPFTERTRDRIGKVDYIANFAADSHVDRSIDDPESTIRNNTGIALTLLEYARWAKPKTFVQISTDEVYGPAPEGTDHIEWAPIVPSNPYAASKACQEAIAVSYWRTYGVPLIITNTMNNFGERQDAEKYVAKVIRAIAAGETITIHGTKDNIGARHYLHARNHADAILHLLKTAPPKPYREGETMLPDRFNVVGEAELNNLEIAQKIAGIMGKKFKYQFVDFHKARPGHDRRYSLDGTRLKDMGWEAPFDLDASLKRTVDWTLTHPAWL